MHHEHLRRLGRRNELRYFLLLLLLFFPPSNAQLFSLLFENDVSVLDVSAELKRMVINWCDWMRVSISNGRRTVGYPAAYNGQVPRYKYCIFSLFTTFYLNPHTSFKTKHIPPIRQPKSPSSQSPKISTTRLTAYYFLTYTHLPKSPIQPIATSNSLLNSSSTNHPINSPPTNHTIPPSPCPHHSTASNNQNPRNPSAKAPANSSSAPQSATHTRPYGHHCSPR